MRSTLEYADRSVPLYHIVETFRGENVNKFRGFRATRESFLHKIWVCHTHLPYFLDQTPQLLFSSAETRGDYSRAGTIALLYDMHVRMS